MKIFVSSVFLLSITILSCNATEMQEETPLVQKDLPPVSTTPENKDTGFSAPPTSVALPVFGPPQGYGTPWDYNPETATLEVLKVGDVLLGECEFRKNANLEQYLYFKYPIDLSKWDTQNKTIQISMRHRYDLVSQLFPENRGLLKSGEILVYDEEPPRDVSSANPPTPIAKWSVAGTHWLDYETVTYFVKRPSGNKIWLALKASSACHGVGLSDRERLDGIANNRWEVASIQVNVVAEKSPEKESGCLPNAPSLSSLSVSLEQAIFEGTDKIYWTYQKDANALIYNKKVDMLVISEGTSRVRFPTVSVKDLPAEVKKLQVKVHHQYNISPEYGFVQNQLNQVRFCLPQAEIAVYEGADTTYPKQLGRMLVLGKKEEVSTISYVISRPDTNNLTFFLNTSLDFVGDVGPVCNRPNPSWKISKIEILPYVE